MKAFETELRLLVSMMTAVGDKKIKRKEN